MTQKRLERLVSAQLKEAKVLDLEIYNLGAAITDDAVGTKTSEGWLESRYSRYTDEIVHTLDGTDTKEIKYL